MGRLTTHVLDTANGCPAQGLHLSLWRIEGDNRTHLRDVVTNADGRLDAPLLEGSSFTSGIYEIVFEVGAYFAKQGVSITDPPFLGAVPVRFGITGGEAHYHVPLLVSPWAYSTYRGS